jgi:hypothetical protein
MRSKILAAFAFTGLLMTAIPLTASARDTSNCWSKPAWGYQHPSLYKNWRRLHCGAGYGNQGNYFGNGAYGYQRNYDEDDGYHRDNGRHNGWRGEHRHWDRGHDGDHGRGRHFHQDHSKGHHGHD